MTTPKETRIRSMWAKQRKVIERYMADHRVFCGSRGRLECSCEICRATREMLAVEEPAGEDPAQLHLPLKL